MSRFLLPCKCGRKLEVSTAQAGERLTCQCGEQLDVPTLRGMQSLERVAEQAPPYAPRRWTKRMGLVFLGLTLVVLAIGGRIWLERTRPKDLIIVESLVPSGMKGTAAYATIDLDGLDELSPADVWLTWHVTTSLALVRGLATSGPVPDPDLAKRAAIADAVMKQWTENWRDWSYLDWGIGGLGLVVAALGLLIPQRKVRRRGKPRAATVVTAEHPH
jgi:hypothetical protein